jgi:hypothetical protein
MAKAKDRGLLTALQARRFLAGAPAVEDLQAVLALLQAHAGVPAVARVAEWFKTFTDPDDRVVMRR